MEADISSTKSVSDGIFISLLVGCIPAGLTFWALHDLNGYLATGVAAIALGVTASVVNKLGYLPYTPPGTVGLDTTNGKPTGKVRGQGLQWATPGLKGQIPLNGQEAEFSPPPFTELVDDVPIEIELLCMGKVIGPKYFAAEDPKQRLSELAEAQARVFTAPWANPDCVILQKSLLPDFLVLPPKDEDPHGEHAAFTAKLMAFTVPGADGKRALPVAGAHAILDNAGTLVSKGYEWDWQSTLVEIEYFDVPQELKDLAVKDLINQKQSLMIQELVDKAKLKPQDALNAVQMVLKLDIKKTVEEFQIRDLDKVGDNIGKLATQIIARFVDKHKGEK